MASCQNQGGYSGAYGGTPASAGYSRIPPPRPAPPPPIWQQPQQQQQQQVVIVNQPGANSVGQRQNIREWSTGLCGCFEDCCSCLYAYCCYPFFMCTLASQLNECVCGPMCVWLPGGHAYQSTHHVRHQGKYPAGLLLCHLVSVLRHATNAP